MSITSSNNLAVNNSLTVNGNSVLGTNSSNTLICNATTTFNNPLTINSNIVQNSGTLNTTSGTNYLNGNVIIGSTKTLTTGTGDTTVNGLLKCNGAATFTSINNSGTYNVINCSAINNSGTLTNAGSLTTGVVEIVDGLNPYIDFKTTGKNPDYDARIICNGGVTGTSGQGTLTISSASTVINSPISTNSTLSVSGTSTLYGVLLTANGITNSNAGIINNSTLTQTGTSVFADVVRVSPGKSLYISNNTFTDYLRMHHTGIGGSSIIDFTGNFSIRNSGTTTPISIDGGTNQVTLSSNLNTNGITNSSTNALVNNGVFTQNNASTFSTNITAPSITSSGTFYAGSSNSFDATAISSPKVINGIASGPVDGASYTNFNLAINSWYGTGFVYSNGAAPSVCKLFINNRTGDLSTQGTITCNSITASGTLSLSGDVSVGNKLTASNGLVVNGTQNESKYFTLKGYSYYGGTSSTFLYTKFDGNSGTSSSETLQIQSSCRCVKITYSYDTTNATPIIFKGCTEYVFVEYLNGGTQNWQQYTAWQVGDNNFQPSFSINTSNQLTITFATNTTASLKFLSWNFAVSMI